MAPENYSTYTVDSIDWGKHSETINATADQLTRFGYTAGDTTDALMRLHQSFEGRKEDRERKKRAVKSMRPFMDLLTDPKVLFLRRWIDVDKPLYVDGSRDGPGDYMDVDPNWLVTIGVAVNIESREIEFWGSSPTSTMCWFIDPVLHGSIDHLTTATDGIFTRQTLEAKWIEVLADLAESEGDFRLTNDPKSITKQEAKAVKEGRRDSLADLLRESEVVDRWARAEDWSKPPPFSPGSPPGTYTLSSGDNYFSTIFDSVTAAPDPDDGLTIEKMMDLSKQLKQAKEDRYGKNNEFFFRVTNTTA